jgi:hypothetical protein
MEEAEVDMMFYPYQAVANFCSLNRDPEAKRLPASSDYQGPFRHEFFGPESGTSLPRSRSEWQLPHELRESIQLFLDSQNLLSKT